MKWTEGAKEGIVVAGGHGKGSNLTQIVISLWSYRRSIRYSL